MITKSKAWKIIFSMLLIMILVMNVNTIHVSASTVYACLDNDTTSKGFVNYKRGGWAYLSTLNYNSPGFQPYWGDERQYNGIYSSDYYYSWTSYSSHVNELTDMRVYLWDDQPVSMADYYILDSSGHFAYISSIDQNTAQYGWNKLYWEHPIIPNQYFDIIVKPAFDDFRPIAADCIEVYYTN
ncbi:MAG: hypothetical protein QME45_12520 [Clostridiales bacterium]|nr:hypothetical protein [Clostridiales bacterium]